MRRFKRFLILGSAVLLPLLVGAASPDLVGQVRMFAIGLARPFLEAQSQVLHFSKRQIQHLVEWPKLRAENEALHLELERLKQNLVDLEEMKRERARLESLVGLKEKSFRQGLAARVIARDLSHWSHFIVINKGARDGVRKNTILVHPDGLVGKVVASGADSARAILLIDAKSRVSAMNQRTRDTGLLEGTGSPTLKMTYLDREANVQVGDVVISSGLGGIYPKGIPIGKVEVVGGEKHPIGLYALVKPFVSFSKLEELLCLYSQTEN